VLAVTHILRPLSAARQATKRETPPAKDPFTGGVLIHSHALLRTVTFYQFEVSPVVEQGG
jgi:hypothetical protein